MKKIVSLVLVMMVAFALTGCVSTQDFDELSEEVINLRLDLIKMENEVELSFEEVDEMEYGIRSDISFLRQWLVDQYSNEEIDERFEDLLILLQELEESDDWIIDLLYASYVEYDEENNLLVSDCEIIEGIKRCTVLVDLNELGSD